MIKKLFETIRGWFSGKHECNPFELPKPFVLVSSPIDGKFKFSIAADIDVQPDKATGEMKISISSFLFAAKNQDGMRFIETSAPREMQATMALIALAVSSNIAHSSSERYTRVYPQEMQVDGQPIDKKLLN